ncbi:receptor expression-enhancing protein 5-like isoform X1 [Dermacentor albipictus]|uniref:receptor expression-enhancing protein 5-like isoform X1 n=1 Tax=Dermacentor albipictus TaxID=60249 RepID=UPI0031FD4A52
MAEMHQELSSVIREKSVLSGLFAKLEAATKLDRIKLVYALVIVVVILYGLNLAGAGVTHLITTVWPVLGSAPCRGGPHLVYDARDSADAGITSWRHSGSSTSTFGYLACGRSLRAMDRQSVDLQQKWLGYWMLYAFVNSFEWMFVKAQKKMKRIYILKLLVLTVCALPHPLCPARLLYARFLRRRIWLEGGGAPSSSSPAMGSTVVDHLSVSRTSDGHESPTRKKPTQNPPKKPLSTAKKGK